VSPEERNNLVQTIAEKYHLSDIGRTYLANEATALAMENLADAERFACKLLQLWEQNACDAETELYRRLHHSVRGNL
jgi:NAD dependent epimerase/dehydratase family enzyme